MNDSMDVANKGALRKRNCEISNKRDQLGKRWLAYVAALALEVGGSIVFADNADFPLRLITASPDPMHEISCIPKPLPHAWLTLDCPELNLQIPSQNHEILQERKNVVDPILVIVSCGCRRFLCSP